MISILSNPRRHQFRTIDRPFWVQPIESCAVLGNGGANPSKECDAVIAFDNVAYSYGGGALLSDISLLLAPGSFHFLTGPSGAGKSTFLKLCYGALSPTAGRKIGRAHV